MVIFHFQAKKCTRKLKRCLKLTSYGQNEPVGGLKASLKTLELHNFFHRCSIPYIFSSEKNIRWYYFILSPKNLPENAENF